MTMREYFELFWLNLVVKKRLFVEYLRIIWRYYGNRLFRTSDLMLLSKYLFRSPYSISKQFLLKKGVEDVYTYGETPLTTLDLIAQQCHITAQDTVFELGCGRGRGCFWLHAFTGCKAVGIEYIPDFVAKAQEVQERLKIQDVQFRLGDILEADYIGATVLYLYGTCFEAPFLQQLIKKIAALPPGTKVITVSYPLTSYTKAPLFVVMKRFTAPFTWGEADVYFQIRK